MPQALDLSMTCVPGASAGASALEAKDQDVTVIPKTNDLYFVNEPLFHEVGVASVSQVDAQVVHTVPGLSSSGADVAAPLNGDAADAPEIIDIGIVAGALEGNDEDVSSLTAASSSIAKVQKTKKEKNKEGRERPSLHRSLL